jgi:hypothetical protein
LRRLALLTIAATMALAAIAYAVTDTMTYSAVGSHKGKPSKIKPAPFSYTGTLTVDTNPPGQQPDVGPSTTVYFAKGIKNNGVYFPSCTKAEIDAQQPTPAKCVKATVGTGTAVAYAGQPGSPKSQSIREELTVKAINGPKGKTLFLLVATKPGSPVPITNRAIPGAVRAASGAFAYSIRFDIPQDLQEPVPGVKVALTNFSVTIPKTLHKVRVKGQTVRRSYLALTACRGHMAVKAITQFKDDAGALHPVTSTSSGRC